MGKLIKTWQDITARSFWNCIMERGIFIRQVAQRLILTFSATPTPISGSWENYNQIRMQFMIAKHLITVDYNPFWLTTRFPIVPTNLNNYQKPLNSYAQKCCMWSRARSQNLLEVQSSHDILCNANISPTESQFHEGFPRMHFQSSTMATKKSFAHFVFDSILDLFSSVLNNARMCKLG